LKSDWIIQEELAKHTRMVSLGNIKVTPLKMKLMNFFSSMSFSMLRKEPDIGIKRHLIPGYHNVPLKISVYMNKKINQVQPVLIHFHGGGFFLKASQNAKHLAMTYALEAGVKVVYVDYHLAPKYKYPFAIEECYQALLWVFENAEALQIDKNQIIVSGDSAGGMLAATMPHLSQERNGPKIGYQMLIYPVIDSSVSTPSMLEFVDAYVWNSSLNKQMWEIYLNPEQKGEKAYHQLLSLPVNEAFPEAYIEVHEYDCLRDEGILYAQKLKESGVKVELKYVKGSFHGADVFYKTNFVSKLIHSRVKAIQKYLKN